MISDVTIVIPYHAERRRNGMLDTALWSVNAQRYRVYYILAEDAHGQGAAIARQAGLDTVHTQWVAFLDSDDWLYPEHIELLRAGAFQYDADYIYSYFTPYDMWEGCRGPDLDPLQLFGHRFDPANPTQTTSTILVRTELAKQIGFRTQPDDHTIPGKPHLRYGEDYDFTVRCNAAGAKIVHIPRRTWAWRIGRHNTSGMPGHGDAAA